MRYLSLFSGIEAASVAWHPLGWTPVAFAEIEPFPAAVLAHRFPNVPNLGDVTAVDWTQYRGKVDVLVGGAPCQAFSVAGLRRSLDDRRGNLTLHFVEACNDVDPEVIVFENVPGILSTKDNAFGCLLAGLVGAAEPLVAPRGKWARAGLAVGPQRAAAWRVLDAQHFGVAQRRQRVFVCAVRGARAGAAAVEILLEPESVQRDPPSRGSARSGLAGHPAASLGLGGVAGCLSASDGGPDCIDGRAGHLIPGSVPDVAWCLQERDAKGADSDTKPGHLIPLLEPGRRTGRATSDVGCGIGIGEPGDPMYTLGAGPPHGVLAPVAFDTTQITHPANRSQPKPGDPCHPLAQAGHPPAVAFHLTQDPISGEIAPAMSQGKPKGCPTIGVQQEMSVRRLTPRECERLQGFPDDWTLIPGAGPKTKKLEEDYIKYLMRPVNGVRRTREECFGLAADGPRYRALGNSMAVPVMNWIGRRIKRAYGSHTTTGPNRPVEAAPELETIDDGATFDFAPLEAPELET